MQKQAFPYHNDTSHNGKLIDISQQIYTARQKNVEQLLKESEEKYRTLFEQAADSITLTDPETGRIVEFNEKAHQNLGYTREEFKKLKIENIELIESPEEVKKHIKNITRKGSDVFESKHRTKNGQIRDVWISSRAVSIGGRIFLQGIWRDITSKKQAEKRNKEDVKKLQKVIEGTIMAMAKTVEMRDPYTAGHQRRVSNLACAIAKRMNLDREQIKCVRVAATLHDIGKIYVPSEILTKPRKLTRMEMNIIREHSRVGYEILKSEEFPWPVAEIVLQHHERANGSGYPAGLRGKDMSLAARIIAVADTAEAMSSHRPYRPARGIEKALKHIKGNKGRLFDRKVVDACLSIFPNKYLQKK
ncbi:MAG: HD domain-containing protein [Candidatus Omnitrophota bacterium]|nr:MAG: HD domain-containing protein [Candidatus Omnitrophota bacterium]